MSFSKLATAMARVSLAQEVASEATGDLKARAQRMVAELS